MHNSNYFFPFLQLYSRSLRSGLCMSHVSTISKVDEMGKSFEKKVLMWKHAIEHDCKVEQMLSAIEEAVQEMTEVVPEGLDTLDVSSLGISCIENPSNEITNMDTDILSSDPELKIMVSEKLGSHFDDAIFNETINMIDVSGCSSLEINKLIALKKQVQLTHAPGFQLIGDNIDMLIKVKHMSSTNQNKSIHWFNLNAVQDRVLGNEKDDKKPIKSIMDMQNVEFLPSAMDHQKLLNDIIPLAAKVIADRIPAFKSFRSAVVRHIPHSYSDEMRKKTNQVSQFSIYLLTKCVPLSHYYTLMICLLYIYMVYTAISTNVEYQILHRKIQD